MGAFRKWGVGFAAALTTSFALATGAMATPDDGGRAAIDMPDRRLDRSNMYPESSVGYYYNSGSLAPLSPEAVDVRLLLIFDASDSMKASEYEVQIYGAANALTSDFVKNAWFGYPDERSSGPIESIAIGVVVFDKWARMRMPWVDFRVDDPNLDGRLETFANQLRTLVETRDKSDNVGTDITSALEYAVQMYNNAPWESRYRDVIDLSGDGRSNEQSNRLPEVKTVLAEMDVTINGLAMVNEQEEIVEYYEQNLITRLDEATEANLGHVWVVARNMQNDDNDESMYLSFQRGFEQALKEKLVWEVANIDPRTLYPATGSVVERETTTQPYVYLRPVSYQIR